MSDKTPKLKKQNGRPKLSPDQLRTFQINLSLSKSENDFIEQQAKKAKLIPSIFCRRAVLNSALKILNPEFIEQLKIFNRLGVNINQIAMRLNIGHFEESPINEFQSLIKEYKENINIFIKENRK